MRLLTITTVVVLLAASAQGLSPADKCEAAKLKLAGKYGFCRLKAESKAVKTGTAPDYSLCDLKYGSKWSGAETTGAGQCPSTGDLVAMQARITTDGTEIAACLAGTCPVSPICGDGNINGAELCDGSDLGGTTCVDLGFAGGTLSCTVACVFDLAACDPVTVAAGGLPKTGQQLCYDAVSPYPVIPCTGTGQDGEDQAGAPFSFTDNGDGTISDNNTRLMWEKKSSDGAIHERSAIYTWAQALAYVASLNSTNFAGHSDWRLPNIRELTSLIDWGRCSSAFFGSPCADVAAIPPVFSGPCSASCSNLSCSCEASDSYITWSSTTDAAHVFSAWGVQFIYGPVTSTVGKTGFGHARAVRGSN